MRYFFDIRTPLFLDADDFGEELPSIERRVTLPRSSANTSSRTASTICASSPKASSKSATLKGSKKQCAWSMF